MSLHADLLEQAEHLTRRESKRPKQASLRRAVSTAYYALFHLLTTDAALLLAPNTDEATRHKMPRWFDHTQMKETCGRFLPTALAAPLKDLIGTSASVNLQQVARAFIALHEARNEADYNAASTYTRTQAQAFVQQAQDAFDAWQHVRKTSEANIFMLSLLLYKMWGRGH